MQAFHDQHAVDSDDEASSIASRSTTRTTASAPPASNRRSASRTSNNERASGWQGFQFFNYVARPTPIPTVQSHAQKSIMKSTPFKTAPNKINNLCNVMLLNSGSSIDGTFCNDALVTNVRPADRKINMQTNTGVATLDVQADVPGYGPVYLDKNHVTNIFGLANMVDTCD